MSKKLGVKSRLVIKILHVYLSFAKKSPITRAWRVEYDERDSGFRLDL